MRGRTLLIGHNNEVVYLIGEPRARRHNSRMETRK